MLAVPGVSKEQHGPGFQRYQRCSRAVQGVGGLDQNGSTGDDADLEVGKENGKKANGGQNIHSREIIWGHYCRILPTTGRPGRRQPAPE